MCMFIFLFFYIDVWIAKCVKYKVGDRCNLGGGGEECDMEEGKFVDGLEGGTNPNLEPGVPSNVSRGLNASQVEIVYHLVPKTPGVKPKDILQMPQMQMVSEVQ